MRNQISKLLKGLAILAILAGGSGCGLFQQTITTEPTDDGQCGKDFAMNGRLRSVCKSYVKAKLLLDKGDALAAERALPRRIIDKEPYYLAFKEAVAAAKAFTRLSPHRRPPQHCVWLSVWLRASQQTRPRKLRHYVQRCRRISAGRL